MGWRSLRRFYLALAVLVFSMDAVNVLSVLHDRAEAGVPTPAWEPVVWEYTSGVFVLAFSTLIIAALRLAPPVRGGWVRFALVHPPATLAFSVLHVGGMVLARMAIYAAVGRRYGMPLSEFPYEYRKDLISYVTIAGTFWLWRRIAERRPATAAPEPAVFDIRDGGRVIRARIGDIASASSAGNYVEFTLADGRRPLMRCTLASLEEALAPHGFVRTHRSWLVNPARVSGLIPHGSGDFTVELDIGAAAPLSRRFPEAHRRLRPALGSSPMTS